MTEQRNDKNQGQKKGQQNPGREDDKGMDKGARGTDSSKGAQRTEKTGNDKTEQRK